jgi:N-acylneuraminate cytidylyltransferase|tara:strand:- start:1381 stop:2064 length:684 start_codon:yes stop_codon:yes gene_type:complete
MKIAIIPARAKSKRIKNKNLQLFNGKPLIVHAIKSAIESKLFDKVIVSTDSKKIQSLSKKSGAICSFLRPKNISGDKTITAPVLLHVIKKLKLTQIKYICCIYPTAVLMKKNNLKKGLKKLIISNADCCYAITEYDFPILRSVNYKAKYLKYNWEKYKNYRSQDLDLAYHDAGQFYWLKYKTFIKHKSLYPNKSAGLIIDRNHVQDIDDYTDFKLAKIKYKLFKKDV